MVINIRVMERKSTKTYPCGPLLRSCAGSFLPHCISKGARGWRQMFIFGVKLLCMLIIGIAGGTGSGKTTVVNQIVDQSPENEVGVISQDSYYNDLSHLERAERAKVNFDHPSSIDFDLLIAHLKQLREGQTVQTPIYSFVEETRLGK